MSDFHKVRPIKRTRKAHHCEQCGRTIDLGSAAIAVSGSFYGDFYSMHTHVECEAAASAYAELNDLWGEDFPWFQHMDATRDDWEWLTADHPIVAARLGWDSKLADDIRAMAE